VTVRIGSVDGFGSEAAVKGAGAAIAAPAVVARASSAGKKIFFSTESLPL
jgi:hypothetical protein